MPIIERVPVYIMAQGSFEWRDAEIKCDRCMNLFESFEDIQYVKTRCGCCSLRVCIKCKDEK